MHDTVDLTFIYTNKKQETQTWFLLKVVETEHHFSGIERNTGAYRTFIKSSVVEYLNGSEQLLQTPFAAAPAQIPKDTSLEILFTGFGASLKKTLEDKANNTQGLRVVKSATKTLKFICCGANAGPTKVRIALEQGAFVLTELDFMKLCETGELPL